MRCRRADGVYHWFLNRNLALRDDEGKIVKWYGILFDIDALKKTESALQAREQQLVRHYRNNPLNDRVDLARPENSRSSLKEPLNILGLPSKISLRTGGGSLFILMI